MNEMILECRKLSKIYNKKERALNSISLSLPKGKIIGLLGPNGSGKTTLIKLVNGLITPSEGKVFIDGLEPGVETKRKVAYLPDKNHLNERQTVDSVNRVTP